MSFGRGGTLGRGFSRMGAGGAPGWVLPGALVDLDFANFRYWGGDPTSLLAVARASSGNAADSSGLVIPFGNNVLRQTNQGLLIEEARTNVVLWCRDLTNPAWTKTSTTAAKDQSGPDGVANSASSLTATGANGTCLQAITLASSARFQSAYVKRITGSGTIQMTMDNGATWTNIAVTSGWQQLTIPTQTLANPTVGFRIVTSGDAIAVDFVQNENGSFQTSPIATTSASASRAEDNVTATATINAIVQGAQGSAYVSAGLTPNSSVTGNPTALGESSASPCLFNTTGASPTVRWRTWNGARNLLCADGGVNPTTSYIPGAAGWSAAGTSIVTNGGTVASDGNPIALTGYAGGLAFGRDSGTAGQDAFNGYIKRAAFWNSRLPDAMLKTISTR
jgi:hypothetical protein